MTGNTCGSGRRFILLFFLSSSDYGSIYAAKFKWQCNLQFEIQ